MLSESGDMPAPVSRPPKWMSKHPCPACGSGYGFCAQFAVYGLKCCKDCEHPGRWAPDPYSADDYVEMWAGREMPEAVRRYVEEHA